MENMVAQHKAEALRLRDDIFYRNFKLVKYRTKNLFSPNRQEWSFVPFYAKRCIFIHIPKAAGIATAQSLFHNLGGGHEPLEYYQSIFSPKDFASFFKFTIVRNPWDRVHSAYEFLKTGGFGPNDQKWFDENLSHLNGFEDFILNWLDESTLRSYIHFFPQTGFILNQHGQIQMDFIGKFENLANDYDRIASKINTYRSLQFSNVNKKKKEHSNAYNQSMIEKVGDLYAEDISNFNYQFDNENE